MHADDKRDLEQLYRQFLHVEIAIGLTYARLATTAYAHGHRAHGDRLAAKAHRAAAEVARWMQEAKASGWDVSDLTEESQALRTARLKLRDPVQRAA